MYTEPLLLVILDLGVVPKCTLFGSVKTVSLCSASYCMVFRGKKGQNAAMEDCKKLNAQLPLPKSKEEADEFRKIIGNDDVWIGIRDLTKGGVRSNWKDVKGNSIGNAYVNLRVIYIFLIQHQLLTLQKVGTKPT